MADGFSYDVFLSFRGEDTRYGFTGNLWKALYDRGIRTFIDDEELQKGEEITPSLLKAIEESRIAIIVLSRNYASSSFCLNELSMILDCSIKDQNRSVWPVFYEVDPSDVRRLTGTYGRAMAMHESRSNANMDWLQKLKNVLHQLAFLFCFRFKNDNVDQLQKWKNALHQVANLSGFHYKNGDQYEHEFIGEIIERVSREIKPVTLPVADYPVGLEPQKQNVISLLNVGSDDEVLMLGIHGIGGIGKTTLAVEVYNLIAHRFEGLCYLEDVRENSEKYGLVYLQNIVLSEIIGKKEIESTSVKQGISIMQQRLQQKKLLLFLDDVDKQEQLHAIAGRPDWFGLGSRVIITTRNKRLLTCHGVENTYEVKELNKKDAFDFLGRKAFKTGEVSSGYAHVLNRAVTYASGLPLALEVIGSHLFNKTIEQCEYALDRYERIPEKKIQTILKVSFDALEEEEKNVFLDIACCFKGYKLAMVEKILHAHHGDSKKDHLSVLVEKSLLKISEFGNVTLHDLIEDMGKEIVRQESPEYPGKRSRLWFAEDIIQVLQENSGTSKIQIIYLDSWMKVNWDGEAFKKIENLRTLIIRHGAFSESPKHLPNSLRVLEWWQYPSGGVLSDFYPKKLVICNFRSNFTSSFEWADFFKKKFEKMRVLNFDDSSCLKQTLDISGLLNLEELSFQNCENLTTIDDSVGFLGKLKILRVISCRNLRSIPPLELALLEELDLSQCWSLESFPPVVGGLLGKLKILSVRGCIKLRSIPPLKLTSLEELDLSYCFSLESFPPVVDGLLGKLKILTIKSCNNLRSIPPLKLPSLEELDLSQCWRLESFQPVVDGLLDKLKILSANDCWKLTSFPPLKLPSLEQLDLSYCFSLERFPPVVDGLLGKLKILRVKSCNNLKSIPPLMFASLEELDLSQCRSLESFPHVVDGLLGKLKILRVKSCSNIMSIPPLKLASLEELDLSHCRSLMSFPPMEDGLLDKLKILRVCGCIKLKSIPPLKLTSLEELDLSCCFSLENFPAVVDGLLGKLKILNADHCWTLTSFPPLKLASLEHLNLSYCANLENFPPMVDGLLGKLKSLSVRGCCKLKSIPPLKLALLEQLDFSYCDSLERLPPLVDGFLDKLKILKAKDCNQLRSIPPLKLASLEQLDLSCCHNLESFPEILGEMKNIREFHLENTPIKELSFSFHNLTQLQTLYLYNCGIVQLPTSIVAMSKLAELTIENGGWLFPKPDKGEEKVCPMQSSQVEFLHLLNCDLSDESLAIGLKWFAHVKELYLSGSKYTVLPECIEKCHLLWKLILDNCEELKDIKGIPPSLKTLSALQCNSLTSLCKSRLLNQELHEAGNTSFLLPQAEIPEWFNHQCMEGLSISFWFRNEFPAIALCVVYPLTWSNSQSPVRVIINGNTFFYRDDINEYKLWETNHLHLFHMQLEKFNHSLNRALLENTWNHVEIDFGFPLQKSGIHVLTKKNRMSDIRFINPENDFNIELNL